MKNPSPLSFLTLVALTSSLGASLAFADKTSMPCKEIKQACEAAGFTKGGHKKDGKGLYKDCLQKVLAGEAVAGVSVTPEQVTACKAKKDKRGAREGRPSGDEKPLPKGEKPGA